MNPTAQAYDMNHRRRWAMKMDIFYFCHIYFAQKKKEKALFNFPHWNTKWEHQTWVVFESKLPHWMLSENTECIFPFQQWLCLRLYNPHRNKLKEFIQFCEYRNLCPCISTSEEEKKRILFSQKGAIAVNFCSREKKCKNSISGRIKIHTICICTQYTATARTFHIFCTLILLSWWNF